ncbi:MAG: sugar phosphate nucleotidyltransferase [Geminicoccaceae bacterium]
MRVVILAGGLGWRLSDDNELRPKPMTEVGNKPLIWHQMNYFAHFGYQDFIIALGQRGEYIKKYLVDFFTIGGDVVLDAAGGQVRRTSDAVPWRVEMVDTGLKTQTGGRLKRLAPLLRDETFIVTWGDILHNIDVDELVAAHRRIGRLATLAAVRPPTRFERVEIDDDLVIDFGAGLEPEAPLFGNIGTRGTFGPRIDRGWIAGGLLAMEPGVFDYIDGDRTHLDQEPLRALSRALQLGAYRHHGFWQFVDAMRDKRQLDQLWEDGRAPWKLWE